MKYRIILPLILLLFAQPIFGQKIETNIFDDLVYTSENGNYTAKLEKNIFEDLVFTDNRNNEIKMEKNYLASFLPGIHRNKKQKTKLLLDFVHRSHRDRGYRATYKIDILNKAIIADNRGHRSEEHIDVFGNPEIRTSVQGNESVLRKNPNGGWDFSQGTASATLRENAFGGCIYEDSEGNKLELSRKSWLRLQSKYPSPEYLFEDLIGQYLF